VDFVRDNPGESVPEETFTHSHSLWSSIGTLHFILHTFSQSLPSFRNTCPYHRNLFRCSTEIMSSKPSLPLNSLLGTLSCNFTLHIHLTILISALWSATSFFFLTGQVSLPCNILLRTQPVEVICGVCMHAVDVDECQATADVCGQFADCSNMPGSYQCSCQKGYTGTPPHCTRTSIAAAARVKLNRPTENNYATKYPLVTMGCPTFTPKTPSSPLTITTPI